MPFLIILGILNVFFIISVIFIEYKKPEEAILWVLILTVFPGIGVIFYILFANTLTIKINAFVKGRKFREPYNEQLKKQIESIKAINVEKFAEHGAKDIAPIIHFNFQYNESLMMQNNEVEMLLWGQDKFASMFEDFRNAKRYIHIEYYALDGDYVGKEMVDILTQKAREGVEVKIILDWFGGLKAPNSLFRQLKKAGGKVKRSRASGTHFRNHRKMVIIDGEIGYTGGMNIGKVYLSVDKVKSPWRDTHMKIKGDGVYALEYIFLGDWITLCRRNQIDSEFENIEKYFTVHNVEKVLLCQFVTGGIYSDKSTIKMSYLRLLMSAKKRVWIQTPYIVPDTTTLDAIRVIASSGVEVNIMVAGVMPSVYLKPVTNHNIEELRKYGVRIFEYNGYLHSKTMLVDDMVTSVGSANFDQRSYELNDEVCVFFYDEEFNRRNEQIFLEDMKNSKEVDYEAFAKRPWIAKVAERFFRIFTPLM